MKLGVNTAKAGLINALLVMILVAILFVGIINV